MDTSWRLLKHNATCCRIASPRWASAPGCSLSRCAPARQQQPRLREKRGLTCTHTPRLQVHIWDVECGAALAAAAPRLPQLVLCHLECVGAAEDTDVAARTIVAGAPSWPHLANLRISRGHIGATAAQDLGAALAAFERLRVLDVRGNRLSADDVVALLAHASRWPQLRTALLSGNKIGCVAALSQALPHWPLLGRLEVNSTRVSGEDGEAFIASLAHACPRLSQLGLRNSGVRGSTAAGLVRAIAGGAWKNLERLELGQNHLNAECARALVAAVRRSCPRIAVVRVVGNSRAWSVVDAPAWFVCNDL